MKWTRRNNIKPEGLLLLDDLAKVRGIKNLDEWLSPSSSHYIDHFKLSNMNEAVNTVIKAINLNLKIVIVADIDGDGIFSTALMYNYLKEMVESENLSYVHAQRSQGHGLETVMDKIEDDVDLIIIVDSSSNSVKECKHFYDLGKEIVIIDHHICDVENPYATIVNCQLGDYPNKHLSGSAMCFKFVRALDDMMGYTLSDMFEDLSAFGLIADLMNMAELENRYLVYQGLNNVKNIGLKKLLNHCKINYYDESLSTTQIGFNVNPIISSCSRLDKIELALELLTTDDDERALELVTEMAELNELRKTMQKEIMDRVKPNIDSNDNIVVYIDNKISSGFRGLIATDVCKLKGKPAFILHEKDIYSYGGSVRSVDGINLKSLCIESGLFSLAMGHEQAFGVEFKKEQLQDVLDFFNNELDTESLVPTMLYDLEVDIKEIELMDVKEVEKFSQIVGFGFETPKFLIKGLTPTTKFSKKLGHHVRAVMGKNEDTVKINCLNDVTVLKFKTNDSYMKDVETHVEYNFETELHVVGSLNVNSFFNWSTRKNEVTISVFADDYTIYDK